MTSIPKPYSIVFARVKDVDGKLTWTTTKMTDSYVEKGIEELDTCHDWYFVSRLALRPIYNLANNKLLFITDAIFELSLKLLTVELGGGCGGNDEVKCERKIDARLIVATYVTLVFRMFELIKADMKTTLIKDDQ